MELLGALDDKIALNRCVAATLEEIARALFKSWFVDFDPVRAKAEGRPTGLPDDIAALFPDRFGDDGLPEGWRRVLADDLVEVNPTVSLPQGTPAPYVEMAALPTSGPRVQGVINRPGGSGARFQNADTLLARITPCLENGKTALVDVLDGDRAGWGSTEFIVLRARPGVPAEWPYLLARDEAFRAHVIASMSGTSGRQRAPPSAVSRWEVARPGSSIFDAFGRASKALFARLTSLSEQSASLAEVNRDGETRTERRGCFR